MSKTRGLAFQRFDLHVHTPGSEDFADRDVTAEQVVTEALKKGLRGIAVTDHNTGEWVDAVKNAAEGTDLVVFPGAEIYCTGGKSGIHVLALLDPAKGTKHINALLAALEFDPMRLPASSLAPSNTWATEKTGTLNIRVGRPE